MILDNKQQAMSSIHDKAKRAKAILKEVEQAFEHGTKQRLLQKELAWAYVSDAEMVCPPFSLQGIACTP